MGRAREGHVLVVLVGTILFVSSVSAIAQSVASDPNLPQGKGLVVLAPNPLGATAVAYAYQAGDIPTALAVPFGGQIHGMVYLGFNAEGTWMYEQDAVYILKGNVFRRASVKSPAEVPNGLKNPSPQYLADHGGVPAGGKAGAAANGPYGEDPNFPNARGEIALRANTFNIKKLFYHYPAGPKSLPIVEADHSVGGGGAFLLYQGYNEDGTWFQGRMVLKGDLLAQAPANFSIYSLPLGLKNPAPEYFQHTPFPTVFFRSLYGDDPNFPKSAGNIVLAPNALGAQCITYWFNPWDEKWQPAVLIYFADKVNGRYLGHNAQGSWIAAFDASQAIYILNGNQLSLAPAKSLEQVPNDLKDASDLYTSHHPGTKLTPHNAPYFAGAMVTREGDETSATIVPTGFNNVHGYQVGAAGDVMKFRVRRPAPNAVAPAGLPPIFRREDGQGTWVWIGEGTEKGKAAIFNFDHLTGLIFVMVTPEQAAQYLH